DVFPDVVGDDAAGQAGREAAVHAQLPEGLVVHLGDDAAHDHQDVLHSARLECGDELPGDLHLTAGHDAHRDHVDVLLQGRLGDLLHHPEPEVDDLHAGVAEFARDQFRPAAVNIDLLLGQQDLDALLGHGPLLVLCADRPIRGTHSLTYQPNASRIGTIISPLVAPLRAASTSAGMSGPVPSFSAWQASRTPSSASSTAAWSRLAR